MHFHYRLKCLIANTDLDSTTDLSSHFSVKKKTNRPFTNEV